MIPDDNPDYSTLLTLKGVEDILVNYYGAETGDRLTVSEVDQMLAVLRDGSSVILYEVDLVIVPCGTGLYSFFQHREEVLDD